MTRSTQLSRLVQATVGKEAATELMSGLRIAQKLEGFEGCGAPVTRAVVSMALSIALFGDLLARTPTAAAYVSDVRAADDAVSFDHGALRTIRFATGETGALPPGQDAFTRIFTPLGYELAGLYPLDRLGMTGRAYVQQDFPADIPQFFLSELHVERFSSGFQDAAHNTFDSSRDALGRDTLNSLDDLAEQGGLNEAEAASLVSRLASAFGRHHAAPRLADYHALLAESAEAAWIATEGNAFNHATDRVADVEAVATAQRALGRAMKPDVEVSASGRVRQTAFRADPVERVFIDERGGEVRRIVPGSFYEFISRDLEPGGERIDLSFDSSNAQGIFKMTEAVGT